jgi:8-oxo-dGTP diphosphatase
MGKDAQSKETRNPTILREFSAGGVVFKRDKWLVRSTTPSKEFPKSYWMLPKGWIDDAGIGIPGPMASGEIKADEESLQKTALREVEEEGGVKAKVIKKIGTISYPFKHPTRGKILKFVTFYLMEYVEDVDSGHDWETQEVLWLSHAEACKKLSFSSEKQILKKAKELLLTINI